MSELGCAICGGELPPPKYRRPRVVCDDPECLREARRFGGRRRAVQIKREASARPTPLDRYCSRCEQMKPLTEEHFYAAKRDRETGRPLALDRWCKECRREYQRTPQMREAERRRARELRRKLRDLPPDHEAVEARRKRDRERARKWRQKYPQKAHEIQRRYRERVKQDPARLQAARERDRMNYRLRQERKTGVLSQRNRTEYLADEKPMPMLPAAPLAAAIDKLIGREEVALGTNGATEGAVCARLGIHDRQLYAWRTEEIKSVEFNTAQRVLTNSGLLLEDVWPGHPLASVD